MPRTNIPTDSLVKDPWAWKEVTKTQSDDTNDHEFDNTAPEKQILLVINEHATNSMTCVIITAGTIQGLAIADPSQAVAAGEIWATPPMSTRFNQTGGDAGKVFLDLTGTATDIYVAVLGLP
jgi:hypothetical protein